MRGHLSSVTLLPYVPISLRCTTVCGCVCGEICLRRYLCVRLYLCVEYVLCMCQHRVCLCVSVW